MMSDAEFQARFLAQAPSVQEQIIARALEPYLPAITKAVGQAAGAAAEAAKPAIKEALKEYAPYGIALAAGLFGAGILTALWVVKRWGMR